MSSIGGPRDLPVSERPELRVGQIRLDAAQLGPSADPHDRDDLVFSCLDQFDGLGFEIVEHVEPVLHEGAQDVLSLDRAMVIERTLGAR